MVSSINTDVLHYVYLIQQRYESVLKCVKSNVFRNEMWNQKWI